MKKRLLSGVKPTGEIHIGNYFGALKQFVDLQDTYDTFIFIADYHALNQIPDPKQLSNLILETAKTYLAIGLNPEKVTLYRQSDINYVTELCWILNSLTPVGLLSRAHAYKDAKQKDKIANMGLFDYPVLMAADILLYNTNIVPVGQDQKQHMEIAQELARTFNHVYGETLIVPDAYIVKEVAIIKGLDGRKMSKSYQNVIGIFESPEAITKKVFSIVTDSKAANASKDPESDNIFALHKLFSSPDELNNLKERYINGTISYKESKEILANNIIAYFAPIREKKMELDKNPQYVIDVLEQGRQKAYPIAEKLMKEIREKIGITIHV